MLYPTNILADTLLNMLQRDGTGHRKSCSLSGKWHGISLLGSCLIHVILGGITQLVSGYAKAH